MTTDGRRKHRKQEGKARSRKARPGLPDPASIVSEKMFTSPTGRRYRILRTTETDPYDKPAKDKPKRR